VVEHVPEGRRHFELRKLLFEVLQLAFGERATIGSDQFVYWDPTDPKQCLAPDVFVRLGPKDESFQVWKVWERGAPDVAVEILSPNDDRDRNLNEKIEKYRRLGVRELVFFDPERDPPSLRVWDALDGDLVERAVDGLVAPSLCLSATWVVVNDESGALLRLSRDPEGKDLLPTQADLAAQARQAERLERDRRTQAEARVAELEAELRRRGG
jgi:Uma2 family endonuclease